jgi:hypothetical protein
MQRELQKSGDPEPKISSIKKPSITFSLRKGFQMIKKRIAFTLILVFLASLVAPEYALSETYVTDDPEGGYVIAGMVLLTLVLVYWAKKQGKQPKEEKQDNEPAISEYGETLITRSEDLVLLRW